MLVLAGGVILLALCVLFSRVVGFSRSAGAILFIPLWFILAALHLWRAVTGEGAGVDEAFAIFLTVFAVPSALALALWWRLSTPRPPEGRRGN